MARRLLGLVVLIALLTATLGLTTRTTAQDDDNGDGLEATIEALEAEAAARRAATVEALAEEVRAQRTAIADVEVTVEGLTEAMAGQQTAIAELEGQLAAGETTATGAVGVLATPPAGAVLYQADTTGGFEEWSGSGDAWTVRDGMLHNDGTGATWILAPIDLGTVTDYVVEAEIQMVADYCGSSEAGILLRAQRPDPLVVGCTSTYLQIGILNQSVLVTESFPLGTNWHTYRVEVQGDTIRLSLDGLFIFEVSNERVLTDTAGQVGMWSEEVELNVRSYRVLAR